MIGKISEGDEEQLEESVMKPQLRKPVKKKIYRRSRGNKQREMDYCG